MLESLGVDHLRQIFDVISYRGNGALDPADRNTPTGMKWFGRFLTDYTASGHKSDVETDRSVVMLAAVVSPLLPKFIPTVEKRTGTIINLPVMLGELHSKLLAYWECLPGDTLLHWSPRKNYARGAFLYSIVNIDGPLPVTVIDDIHLQWIGAAHKEYSQKSASYLLGFGELTSHFIYDNAGPEAQRLYNFQMGSEDPLLTFTAPGGNGKRTDHEDDVVAIGGIRIDRRCLVALERMVKAQGFSDLSKLSFFRLTELLGDNQNNDLRPTLTMSAEWSEEDNKTILSLLSNLSKLHLDTAAEIFHFNAVMSRLGNSSDNMMHCLHTARMAPLVGTLHGILQSDDGNEIDEAVMCSNPFVHQAEYTREMDLLARGKVIKYFVENERMNKPRDVSDELLRWLGENSDDLALHIKTLVKHERVDRELFEVVLATSAFGSGAL